MADERLQEEADRFLIAEICAGSAEAFESLVERFGGRLKKFAARQLHGSGLDPEDAVQDTFVSLLRHRDSLTDVRSLQAYLFRVLRCRVVDLVRARGPRGRSLDSIDSEGAVEPRSPVGTPSTYARRDEALEARSVVLADVLDEHLSRLKAERRFRDLKVLEVLFSRGCTQQEAASAAGTSEPTVSRIRSACVEVLGKLARRHRQAAALEDLPAGDDASDLIHEVWQENLFSCIKRSTLGSYLLGVLDAEWQDYVHFHLEVAGCDYCAAHLDELKEGEEISEPAKERIFQSSIGFLRK